MFKKLICAVLICLMAFTLFACKVNPQQNTTPSPTKVVMDDKDVILSEYKTEIRNLNDFMMRFHSVTLNIDVAKDLTGKAGKKIADKGTLTFTPEKTSGDSICELTMERNTDGKVLKTELKGGQTIPCKVTVDGVEKTIVGQEFLDKMNQTANIHMPDFEKNAIEKLEKDIKDNGDVAYVFTLSAAKMADEVKKIEADVDLTKEQVTVKNMTVTYTVNASSQPLSMQVNYEASVNGKDVNNIKTNATYTYVYSEN